MDSGERSPLGRVEAMLAALRPTAPRLRSLRHTAVEEFLKAHKQYRVDGGSATLKHLIEDGVWLLLTIKYPQWTTAIEEEKMKLLQGLVERDADQIIQSMMLMRMSGAGAEKFADYAARFLQDYERLPAGSKSSPAIVELLVKSFIDGITPSRLLTRVRLAYLRDGPGNEEAEVPEVEEFGESRPEESVSTVVGPSEAQKGVDKEHAKSPMYQVITLAAKLVEEEDRAAALLGVRSLPPTRAPQPPPRVSHTQMTCFACGGRGHMARDCRRGAPGRAQMTGRTNYPRQDAQGPVKATPPMSSMDRGKGKGAVKEKLERGSPEQSRPVEQRRNVCYTCGSPDHYANRCPQRTLNLRSRAVPVGAGETSKNQAVNVLVQEDSQARADRFVVELTVGREKKSVVSALIDTGTNVSVVRTSVASIIDGERVPKDTIIDTADGRSIGSKGVIKTAITIGGQVQDVTFAEVDQLTDDMIVGTDILGMADVVLNVGEKSISIAASGEDDVEEQVRRKTLRESDQELNAALEGAIGKATPELKGGMQKLVCKYRDLFEELPVEGSALPPHKIVLLSDALPSSERLRRLSPEQATFVHEEIRRLLQLRIIEESSSPWAAPMVLVRKRNGQWRMCIDFRKLNGRTKKDSFPLPQMDDLFDRLSGMCYFTTLDLNAGYYQVPVEDSSKELTSFITDSGLYQFRRMPFGLCGAPATFQRGMNGLLAGHSGTLVYMDDVCVAGATAEEMLGRLERVFESMRKARLRLNVSKCEFGATVVKYLGQEVSADGRRVDPTRIQGLREMTAPKNAAQLKSFLGLISFYRRYIGNLSNVASPLYQLLRNGVRFKWGDAEQAAFQALKQGLIEAPMLAHPDPNAVYVLRTDASDVGIGAVLIQHGRPIAFLSRTLTDAERRWSVIDKEAWAIVWSIDKLRPYLLDARFHVETDHKNLRFIQNCSSPRVVRWRLKLAEYDFEVTHIPGKENCVADSLSRLCALSEVEEGQMLNQEGEHGTVDEVKKWIVDAQKEAPEEEKKRWEASAKFSFDEESKTWCRRKLGEWKKVVPKTGVALQLKLVALAHTHMLAGHFGIQRVLKELRAVVWWPNMQATVTAYIERCPACQRRQRPVVHGPYYAPQEQEMNRRWHIDFLGPLAQSEKGSRHILVMVEAFTRWVELYPTPEATAEAAVDGVWKCLVCRYGVPDVIVSDNGKHFDNALVGRLCEKLGVRHQFVIPYRPQANGRVERQNRVIMDTLRALTKDTEQWDQHLDATRFAMNSAVSTSIQESPFKMMFGRDPVTPLRFVMQGAEGTRTEATEKSDASHVFDLMCKLQSIHAEASRHQQRSADRARKEYAKREKASYKEGDLVLKVPVRRLHKLAQRLTGPYRVIKHINDVVVVIEDLVTGVESKIHVDRIVPYDPSDQSMRQIIQETTPEEEYIVEEVLQHRKHRGGWIFEIKWLGYPPEDNTWEPEENVGHVAVTKRYAKRHGLTLKG